MKLPEAIQRQVEEAEALEQQLYAQSSDNAQEAQASEAVAAVESTADATDHVEPEPQTEVQPAAEIKAKPGREDDLDYWRSRASTLYGMNQQQASELQTVKAQMQELMSEVSRMRDVKAQPVAPQDNDAETFGEDLVATMDRRAEQMAKQLVAKEVGQLQDYVRQLESKLGVVGQEVAVSTQDRFYTQLAQHVPDYEAVNADQGFLNWLTDVDPVYGVPRQAALDAAANAMDVNRVANVFNTYKQLTGKQAQSAKKQQVRQELERQTAPQSTRGSAPNAPVGKSYSQAEYIAALDPRNIKTMGREQADALAADAEAAFYEGRVRFD